MAEAESRLMAAEMRLLRCVEGEMTHFSGSVNKRKQ
jgi:hypothetical protein